MMGTANEFIRRSLRDDRSTGNIDIMGSDGDVRNIERVIKEAFTKRELKAMCKQNGVEVLVEMLTGNRPGSYTRKQEGIFTPVIRIKRNARDDQIVHEFIHHLRSVDDERKGIVRTSYPTDADGKLIVSEKYFRNINDIKNVEESATTAETTARRFSVSGQSGYYSKICGFDPRVAYEYDRRLMTGSRNVEMSNNLRGEKAVAAVIDKYERTMISNAHIYPEEIKGRTAVESWNWLIDAGLVEPDDKNEKNSNV
ncbi:MAG: hypothetical protein FWD37_01520 [Methanomassiliicoccaceae archaeon]|nr:hypothetical protein [Methanomassiliicoccaceae archaeon]